MLLKVTSENFNYSSLEKQGTATLSDIKENVVCDSCHKILGIQVKHDKEQSVLWFEIRAFGIFGVQNFPDNFLG